MSCNLDSTLRPIENESANKRSTVHRVYNNPAYVVKFRARSPKCMKKPSELGTFDRRCFPIEGGCSAEGYDREKAARLTEMKGSKKVETKEGGIPGGEGRKKEQKERGSGGTRGIIRPSAPQAHLLPPLFSYPLHTLPCTTLLDHSRYSPCSPLALCSSRSFNLVSRTLSLLLRAVSRARLHAFRQIELLCVYNSMCAHSDKTIVNPSSKLISSFDIFYKDS